MRKTTVLALLLSALSIPLCLAAAGTWRQLGPDQRGLGQINVLTFDPHNPSRAYAGLNGGGIARSGDGGRTWRTMSEGLTAPRVSAIAVHPALGRLVFAIADGFVHRSSNDGRTWVRLPLARAKVIAPDPRDPAVVWAGTELGLFRSRDAGSTWERFQGNLPASFRVDALAIDAQAPRRMYLGISVPSGFGFWVSENAGRTWIRRSRGVPTALYADLHTAGTVYFQRFDLLYRSRDAGRTLQPFFDPPAFPDAEAVSLALDPRDASTFFVIANDQNGDLPDVFRTTDAGQTWQPFSDGLPAPPRRPTALALSSDGHALVGTQQGGRFGVFRNATSAPQWTAATRGLINTGVLSAAVGRAGALFVNVFGEGVLRSLDGGATWTVSFPFADVLGPLAAAPSDPDTLYVGSYYPSGENPHIVWKTTDGGETWNELPYLPPVDGETRQLSAIDIAVDPTDPDTLFLATNLAGGGLNEWAGLYRSENGGQTWERIGPSGPYLQVKIHPSEPRTVFALLGATSVYRSTDQGDTWTKVLERSSGSVFMAHVVLAPSNPDVVYAVQSDGLLWRSGDGGTSFVSLGRRLPKDWLRSVVVDPTDPDTLLFSGIEGVVRLTLGSGRELLPQAFFTREVVSLLFDPNDPSRLLAGTANAGLVEYRDATH